MITRTGLGATLLASVTLVGLTAGIALTHPAALAGSLGAPASAAQAPERINVVIVPDALLGSNKRTHDAYVPAYLRATAGRQVLVTVYNLDTAPHSFTSPALGLNVIVPAAKAEGLQGTSTFSFTAKKPGTYHWKCILPCDNGGVNAWAMTHDGFMAGTITVTAA